MEVKGPRASQSDIADSDSAQTFTATLDFKLEFVAGFGGPDTAALAFAVMQKHGSAVIREKETVFTAPNFADAADLFRHYAASATSETMQKIRAARFVPSLRGFKFLHELCAPLERAWGSAS